MKRIKFIVVILIMIIVNSPSYIVAQSSNIELYKGPLEQIEIVSTSGAHTLNIVKKPQKMLLTILQDISNQTLIEEMNKKLTNILLLATALIMVISLIYTIILLKNNKKLKAKNDEINILNELRRSFIDADSRHVCLKDQNSKYIFVNKAFANYYDKDSSEIINKDDFDLVDKNVAHARIKTDLAVLENQSTTEYEIRVKNKIFKTKKFPIKLLNGQYGVGAYIEDLTESINSKKEKEKTLLRNSILVDVFTRDFNTSKGQLDYILDKALELTDSKFGYIYLSDEEKEGFVLNTWSKDILGDRIIVERHTKNKLEKIGLWDDIVSKRNHFIDNSFDITSKSNKETEKDNINLSKIMIIPVVVDHKVVAVVGVANKEDDYSDNDVYQITVLMTGVWGAKDRRERKLELEKANKELIDSKDNLNLILNSTAEAIYGIDKNGNCTFCNASCLRMLRYKNEEDLIGKNMHLQIHHSYKDGTVMNLNECKILKSFIQKKGAHVDDEVFWRADGTSFDVEYFSYPQYKDGEIIGAVVTFLDITDRKKAEQEIRHLSYHDPLTGLYNRMFYEEELKRLDIERNLPISIIIGDMNGLKLTNDIFGHESGDMLLIKVAEVFKKVCREEDIIARTGGDEFIVLLPNTKEEEAKKIMSGIKEQFSKESVKAIKGSISMGCATKTSTVQDIFTVHKIAENNMYLEKTVSRKSINANQIKTIIKTLHKISPKEEEHSKAVSNLSQKIGKAMKLKDGQVRRLKEAAFLHDIGKVGLDQRVINNKENLTEEDQKEIKQHPVIGYRILNLFDETVDLAESVLAHHERWDGLGYPKGLKGQEIPKIARIIAVAESFDAMTNKTDKNAISYSEAIDKIKSLAGIKLDPDIVDIFIKTLQDSNES